MTTSIIVTTCGFLDYTKLCVRSILKNTRSPYDLIFVDDISTDDTVEWLKTVPNATVLENDTGKRHGPWAGYNLAMDLKKADYYAFLDRDVVVTPNWLGKLTSTLERLPEVGIAIPTMNVGPGEQSIPQGGGPDSLSPVQRFLGVKNGAYLRSDMGYDDIQRLGKLVEERYFPRVIYNAPVWFHCAVVPHRTIEKVGRLDGSFFWCDGDVDYVYRCLKANLFPAVRRDAYAHHLGSLPGFQVGDRWGKHYDWWQSSTADWLRKYGVPTPTDSLAGKDWNDLLPHKREMEIWD